MTNNAKKPAAKPAAQKSAKPAVVSTIPATESPAAPTAAPKRQNQNGISQPAEGTSCRAVWDAIDTLIKQDKKITLAALRELAGNKMADATIRTQRQRHKTFHGLTA